MPQILESMVGTNFQPINRYARLQNTKKERSRICKSVSMHFIHKQRKEVQLRYIKP